MAKIINLVNIRGKHERYQVYLDNGTSLELAGILAISLSEGQELTDEQVQALRQRELAEDAYDNVLYYLTFRSRSEGEIRKYLADKHYEDVSDDIVTRLKRVGLVDDAAFARQWVENRNNFHPRSKWALRSELRRAGVASELIEQALDAVDDTASALAAGERKAWQMRQLDWPVFRQRLLVFLQRKGFSYNVSDHTVKELWNRVHSEDLK
ncbi:MAG: RecX family transcriptional regulator [Chloroflexi bacterium]|nr:RecX family transcriptional regulator [Chloroflexota bacterium]